MEINSYLEFTQKLLLEEIEPREAIIWINNKFKREKDSLAISMNSCIRRLCRAYYEAEINKISYYDFAVNLRHTIMNYNRRFYISSYLKGQLEKISYNCGLEFDEFDGNIEVNAIEQLPIWLGDTRDFNKVYNFYIEKEKEEVYGDPMLYNMTGFKYYSSECQKFMLRATMNQLEGTTILACMPTGGGKSLVGQMPAYYEENGTTIVIVPTIALAIDQAISTEKLFKGKQYSPRAYYSGINIEKRGIIFNEISRGKLPILYISPEALLNSQFKEVIMTAAENGYIKRFVVDEAHIVVDWGEFFRTEFQFLAVFRRILLGKSKGKLKTLLLSATFSERTTEILKFLFSEEDNFIEIRGDALRDEIMYYIGRSQNNYQRTERLLDLLPILPRPIIIYVSTIKECENLKTAIMDRGFYSVETFNSKTRDDKRESIMRAWNLDQIDIMVATSAFGMGVNKKDVRGVIHCYIPESLDRFYQEVGRAGRDGFHSFSIINTSLKEDKDFINYLTRNKVLTVEKIVSRWEQIKDKYIERIGGNNFWVDMDVTPHYLKDDITGGTSANWNEYVILFLYRQKLLDILDIRSDVKSNRHKILIKVVRNDLLDDSDKLKEYLEPIRDKERNFVDMDIRRVEQLIRYNDNKFESNYNNELCWANYFTKVYYYASEKSCGCPACRKKGRKEYSAKQYIETPDGSNILARSLYSRNSTEELYLEAGREVIYEFNQKYINLENIDALESINEIIKSGVNNLILPKLKDDNWDRLINVMMKNKNFYSIFSYEEFLSKDSNLMLRGKIALVYSNNDKFNDKLYLKLKNGIKKGCFNKVIHIMPQDLYIICENRKLRDCVDGISNYINI